MGWKLLYEGNPAAEQSTSYVLGTEPRKPGRQPHRGPGNAGVFPQVRGPLPGWVTREAKGQWVCGGGVFRRTSGAAGSVGVVWASRPMRTWRWGLNRRRRWPWPKSVSAAEAGLGVTPPSPLPRVVGRGSRRPGRPGRPDQCGGGSGTPGSEAGADSGLWGLVLSKAGPTAPGSPKPASVYLRE